MKKLMLAFAALAAVLGAKAAKPTVMLNDDGTKASFLFESSTKTRQLLLAYGDCDAGDSPSAWEKTIPVATIAAGETSYENFVLPEGFGTNYQIIRAFLSSPADVTDYVQDGLIVHYDGIDNAGVGQHEFSPTVWKDLSGNGHDLAFTNTIDTLTTVAKADSSAFAPTAALVLFATHKTVKETYVASDLVNFGKQRLYSFRVVESGGALRADMIPCVDSSNRVGLYDAVRQCFYGNKGSGTLLPGPAVTATDVPSGYTQLEYIEAQGEQWIETGLVPNGTDTVEGLFKLTDTDTAETKTQTFFCSRKNGTDNNFIVMYVNKNGDTKNSFLHYLSSTKATLAANSLDAYPDFLYLISQSGTARTTTIKRLLANQDSLFVDEGQNETMGNVLPADTQAVTFEYNARPVSFTGTSPRYFVSVPYLGAAGWNAVENSGGLCVMCPRAADAKVDYIGYKCGIGANTLTALVAARTFRTYSALATIARSTDDFRAAHLSIDGVAAEHGSDINLQTRPAAGQLKFRLGGIARTSRTRARAIRVYSRALTSEEERWNAAVDAARFDGAETPVIEASDAVFAPVARPLAITELKKVNKIPVSVDLTFAPCETERRLYIVWGRDNGETLEDWTGSVEIPGGIPAGVSAMSVEIPEEVRGELATARGMRVIAEVPVTAKDYVQENLVVHYDGLDNAGLGVHDAASATWRDLSGNGNDIDLGLVLGARVISGTHDNSAFTPRGQLVLFAMNTGKAAPVYAANELGNKGLHRFYSLTVTDANGKVRMALVPCRDAEGRIGVYDTARRCFLPNCGTTAFGEGSVARKSALPAGYVQLDWIQATGEQWIETGLVPNGTDAITADVLFNNRPNNTNSQTIFCSRNGDWNADAFNVMYQNNTGKFLANMSGTRPAIDADSCDTAANVGLGIRVRVVQDGSARKTTITHLQADDDSMFIDSCTSETANEVFSGKSDLSIEFNARPLWYSGDNPRVLAIIPWLGGAGWSSRKVNDQSVGDVVLVRPGADESHVAYHTYNSGIGSSTLSDLVASKTYLTCCAVPGYMSTIAGSGTKMFVNGEARTVNVNGTLSGTTTALVRENSKKLRLPDKADVLRARMRGLRIYSKKLTEAEAEWNRKVDAARYEGAAVPLKTQASNYTPVLCHGLLLIFK